MFRGKYKSKDEYGKPILYQRGDIILDQGKIYVCEKTTNLSPIQEKVSWKFSAVSNPFKGTNPPLNPVENQLWISDSGVQYVYYKDSDGYQWIST
jgi:hypothetical protein